MVLASCNFDISEFDLRNLCECDETGVEVKKAVKAVETLGFDYDKVNLTFEELKEYVLSKLNPIVFLRFNSQAEYSHAVVVYKISKEKIYVLDPGIGERAFQINDFTEIWSRGLTIIIETKSH